MKNFLEKEYKIFKMFREDWALLTAGTINDYNACTIGWGSLGTLWTRNSETGNVCSVYLHPARYTTQYFNENDTFTISFFSKKYKKELAYMGSHSGRNEDKAKNCGLTPISIQDTVTFEQAKCTIVCKKLYGSLFNKEALQPEIQEYYKSRVQSFPLDENGQWQPHYEFIGEILEVIEKEE